MLVIHGFVPILENGACHENGPINIWFFNFSFKERRWKSQVAKFGDDRIMILPRNEFYKNVLQPNFQQCRASRHTTWSTFGFLFFSEKRGAASTTFKSFEPLWWFLAWWRYFFKLRKKKRWVGSKWIWRGPRFERFKSRQLIQIRLATYTLAIWESCH